MAKIQEKPNVLIYFMDELRADVLGCYGHPFVRTPSIDRIASEGMRFDAAYSNCPLCMPARNCFFTGKYPTEHGVTSNGPADKEFPELAKKYSEDPPTYAFGRVLRAAGYETIAGVGKHHTGFSPEISGFTEYQRTPDRRGAGPARLPDGADPEKSRPVIIPGEAPNTIIGGTYDGDAEDTHAAHTIDRALEWLKQAPGEEPWVLRVSINTPHTPVLPPAPYDSMHEDHVQNWQFSDEEFAARSDIPRKARFVAEHPPHSHRVALAFPGHPEEIHTYRWTRYLRALQASARRLNEETGWDLVPYFDIEPTENGEMADGYHRLMDDVRSDRLAGIIFGYSPHNLSGTELLAERPLPTVCLTGGAKPWGPSIMVDREKLLEKAASFFVGHNRCRLAVVTIMRDNPESLPPVLEKLSQQYGFYSPPRWMHPMDPYHPRWVNHTLGTMLKRPAGDRPDGLIILDDHLVRPVADALNDLGVSIPEELRIVGYWNFPLRYEGETPIMRLGLDTIEQLTRALHLLREEDGSYQPPGPEIRLEPITASEFKQRHGTDAEVAYEIEPPDREFSNVY